MDALGINLPGLITQIISFGILFFILSKLLYKPLVSLMDQRAETVSYTHLTLPTIYSV